MTRTVTPHKLLETIAVALVLVALLLAAPGARAQSSPEQGPGGPVLVVTDPGDPFGTYYAEILRAEGLNEFAVTNTADLTAATLADYQVVVLAQSAVTDAQTTVLTNWVQGGGNLIAMRPDARLAGLLGLGARRARSATATSRSTPPRRPAPGSPRTPCSSTAPRT